MGTLKHTNTQGVFTRNTLPPPVPADTKLETRVCAVSLKRLQEVQVSITEHTVGGVAKRYTVNVVTARGSTYSFGIIYSAQSKGWRSPNFITSTNPHLDYANKYFVGHHNAEVPESCFEHVLNELDKMVVGA